MKHRTQNKEDCSSADDVNAGLGRPVRLGTGERRLSRSIYVGMKRNSHSPQKAVLLPRPVERRAVDGAGIVNLHLMLQVLP